MGGVVTILEQELTRHNGHSMTPKSSRFMGMMEWDPKSLYDLLLATPKNMDSESDSEGSYLPLRECNMLHLSEDGVAAIGGIEDNAYPIPCNPRGIG